MDIEYIKSEYRDLKEALSHFSKFICHSAVFHNHVLPTSYSLTLSDSGETAKLEVLQCNLGCD